MHFKHTLLLLHVQVMRARRPGAMFVEDLTGNGSLTSVFAAILISARDAL